MWALKNMRRYLSTNYTDNIKIDALEVLANIIEGKSDLKFHKQFLGYAKSIKDSCY